MRLGVVVPTFDHFGAGAVITDLIAVAEDLGFDSVWFGDHVVVPDYAVHLTPPNWFDALACAIHGMATSSRLTFGTDVLVAPYRSPLVVAKLVASAVALSGDRLALGCGVGYIRGEFAALGVSFEDRGAITDEYLEVMRLLFRASGPTSFAGEFVRFSDVHFGPAPTLPPPLLVGGNADRAIDRAARLGDGWHPLFPSPERYAIARERIIRRRAELGNSDPFLFSYSCPHSQVLDARQAPAPPPHEGDVADYDYLPALPHTPSGRRRFTGTPDELWEDFDALRTAGVEQAVVRFYIPGDTATTVEHHIEQMRRFAMVVLPEFSAQATKE
jgi:probable F420-dependent oxidoreductase